METAKKIGRPKKYNEPTKTIAFRVPLSLREYIKEEVKKILNKYSNKA
jgi:hypothetical protein